MTWPRVKLGDVSESCLGKMLDQNKNKGEYQQYLSNIDVRWGEFDFSKLGLMKFEKGEQERYGLRYGDLVICEGGEPGRCAIWKDQIPCMKIQKALHRVRVNQSCLDNRFLFYWFLLAGKTEELEQYFTGATIKHMPGQKLKEVKIPLPPLPVQRRIADILSAYDDLIENNRKQIKLLEEAAQRLYKEWFIDLRFPGHEHTPIINGVPEGWKMQTVGDIIDFEIGGGWGNDYPTNRENVPGYVIRGTDINDLMHGDISTIPFRYHSKSNIASRTLKHGDIVFEVSGGGKNEGVGKTVLITDVLLACFNAPVICASFCKLIRLSSIEMSYYLNESIKYWRSCGRISEFEKKSASSIINYRWKDFLNQQVIHIPSAAIMSQYNALSIPMYNKIIHHSLLIEKNAFIRNSLLSKLMNGELIHEHRKVQ